MQKMKPRYLVIIFVLAFGLLLLLTGTVFYKVFLTKSSPFTVENLQDLNDISQIEVSFYGDEESRLIKIIEDKKQIDLIVDTFQKHSNNWQYPKFLPYAPQGPLQLVFYKKELESPFMVITIGYSPKANSENTMFYLTRPLGPAKALTASEFEELLDILEIDQAFTLTSITFNLD